MMSRTAKRYKASFLRQKGWWVAWSDDVPGALTQGKTLREARENLRDAIRLMLEPVDLAKLPKRSARLVQETIEI